jgi:UDP-N-acetylglucosamine acyltransferase
LIDTRAVVDPSARIADDVQIGPYTVIGADVEIGPGCWIGPHVVINGPTRIGCDNKIYQFASLGDVPQDMKYGGEVTRLEIGDRNVIREYCTLNRGTVQGGGITRIADDNWIMAYVHIAHDCQVGSSTIFANNASIAGHVSVEDHVILGGFTIAHQFCRLGSHSFTAMGTVLLRDVPPYVTVAGHSAKPHGINTEGLRRRGFSAEEILALRRAYKLLYKSNLPLKQAIEAIRELAATTPAAQRIVAFLEHSQRGIVR